MKLDALQRSLKRPLVIALLGGSLAGCGNRVATAPGGSSNSRTIAVNAALAGMPDMVSDDLFDVSTSTAVTAGQPRNREPRGDYAAVLLAAHSRLDTALRPGVRGHRLGRPPRTALVVINRRFLGTFNIVPGSAGDPSAPDSANIVHKALDDHWVRHLLLHRFPGGSADHGWHVVAATGVSVTSRNATTDLQSVRVRTSALDTLITDPLQLFAVGHCLQDRARRQPRAPSGDDHAHRRRGARVLARSPRALPQQQRRHVLVHAPPRTGRVGLPVLRGQRAVARHAVRRRASVRLERVDRSTAIGPPPPTPYYE
jgi:hypothetical protein